PLPRARRHRPAGPRPGGGAVRLHGAGDVPRPGIGSRALHRPRGGAGRVPPPVHRPRRRGRAGVRGPGHRVRAGHHRPAPGTRAVRPVAGSDAPGAAAGPEERPGAGRHPMSFLTPLYALGVLAVAAPVVFHLIRRSPRGEVPFGSLMFLSPTPPRLTRRSRLDQVVLLLLRAAALCLLALAFTR